MKIIIAGTRDFNDYKYLEDMVLYLIKDLHKDKIEIVSGKARGADKLGEVFANKFNFKLADYPADWEKFGKAAGYIRNEEMAKYADACVVLWDGASPGTKHMIDLAKKHHLQLRVLYY